jgi:hypothetical protein
MCLSWENIKGLKCLLNVNVMIITAFAICMRKYNNKHIKAELNYDEHLRCLESRLFHLFDVYMNFHHLCDNERELTRHKTLINYAVFFFVLFKQKKNLLIYCIARLSRPN